MINNKMILAAAALAFFANNAHAGSVSDVAAKLDGANDINVNMNDMNGTKSALVNWGIALSKIADTHGQASIRNDGYWLEAPFSDRNKQAQKLGSSIRTARNLICGKINVQGNGTEGFIAGYMNNARP